MVFFLLSVGTALDTETLLTHPLNDPDRRLPLYCCDCDAKVDDVAPDTHGILVNSTLCISCLDEQNHRDANGGEPNTTGRSAF